MSMQAFYTNIASASSAAPEMQALQSITQASLEQVQAVRSEYEWDRWREAK